MKKILKTATVALALFFAVNSAPLPRAAEKPRAHTLVLGGQPFGVKFLGDGVMVVELEAFFSDGRYVCPASDGGLKEGDIIKRVGELPVRTNEELQQATFGCGGMPIAFTIERGGKELIKTVTPKKNTVGIYLLGAWVRDSCAGIGTVTYYDPEEHCFAALGHGICDKDTKTLMPLGSAEVVGVNIRSVTRSEAGKAGSLNGYFTENKLGDLTKNTACGVFGTTNDKTLQSGVTLETADNSELHVGKAQIYTTVEGDECAAYDAEITKICNDDAQSNENFVIKVTDKELLAVTGGIVQGMSGSPVVQDGKLAGAVTHVFLNSPHEGYGITLQNIVSNYKR